MLGFEFRIRLGGVRLRVRVQVRMRVRHWVVDKGRDLTELLAARGPSSMSKGTYIEVRVHLSSKGTMMMLLFCYKCLLVRMMMLLFCCISIC